jgi:hypothetical protein
MDRPSLRKKNSVNSARTMPVKTSPTVAAVVSAPDASVSWLSTSVSCSEATASSSCPRVMGRVRTTKVCTWPMPSLTWAARSPNPAAICWTTSVMIPETTPRPTTSIVAAASDRGHPRFTSPAAPGCSRAASSRATITGITTTAM